MDMLAAMHCFRCIVESGSFTAAAERLDTTHSSVSRQLQQLEAKLGVRLLARNSRGVTPTEAGRDYLQACIDVLARVDAAGERAAQGLGEASGVLRVSMPQVMGSLELPQWLPTFMARHPRVTLDLSCDDRLVDVVGEGFDMAVRIADRLADSGLGARELARTRLVLVAAPGYLATHGVPQTPSNLAQHAFLGLAGARGARQHLVGPGDERLAVPTQARFRSDSVTALHAAVLAGQGIAGFTEFTVLPDLAAGRLQRVLPAHHGGERLYHAVYPHAGAQTAKVRALSDHLSGYYADLAARAVH